MKRAIVYLLFTRCLHDGYGNVLHVSSRHIRERLKDMPSPAVRRVDFAYHSFKEGLL
jgi:hypothetical protein